MKNRLALLGRCALAVAGILVGLSAGTARADILYGITRNNELLTIDPTTGAGSLVGLLSSNMSPPGLAFRGNKLYTYDQVTQSLRQLDPATAATVATINLGINIGVVGGDLTFRSDGIGYLSAGGGAPGLLYSFDLMVPNATLITGALNPTFFGLAFGPGNVLYGLHDGGGPLYTIDQATGVTTLVGNTGLVGLVKGGMACDSAGQLFAALGPNAVPSVLYQIDRSTAAVTVVGNIGFADVSGVAFLQTPPPPPPRPPPPPSGGGVGEGSFVGSHGAPGQEGSFGLGFGGLLAVRDGQDAQAVTANGGPVLQGPFLQSSGVGGPATAWIDPGSGPPAGTQLAVFHVSRWQRSQNSQQITSADGGTWAWAAGLAVGMIALLALGKRRLPASVK